MVCFVIHQKICVWLCVSCVGRQAGCEIWIDVSVWRQVFRVWLRAAAAPAARLALPPLRVQSHHRLWLLVVIGVWNLNMPFHYSKFGLCWRVGNSRRLFGCCCFFSLSLSLSVLCFDLSLVCALVVLGIMRSSNSGAFCKQGRKVDALMFCFRNRNDGPLFGFVCLGEGLKWFQKLLVALSCISLNEKLFQQPSIEVYVLVKILVTLVEIQLQLFIFIHFASFADNCTFSTVYYRNAQFPLLVYYFPMREHRKKTHSLTWLDRSVLASI